MLACPQLSKTDIAAPADEGLRGSAHCPAHRGRASRGRSFERVGRAVAGRPVSARHKTNRGAPGFDGNLSRGRGTLRACARAYGRRGGAETQYSPDAVDGAAPRRITAGVPVTPFVACSWPWTAGEGANFTTSQPEPIDAPPTWRAPLAAERRKSSRAQSVLGWWRHLRPTVATNVVADTSHAATQSNAKARFIFQLGHENANYPRAALLMRGSARGIRCCERTDIKAHCGSGLPPQRPLHSRCSWCSARSPLAISLQGKPVPVTRSSFATGSGAARRLTKMDRRSSRATGHTASFAH
jgi:hypothetical protein